MTVGARSITACLAELARARARLAPQTGDPTGALWAELAAACEATLPPPPPEPEPDPGPKLTPSADR